jgi:hypothetical protein
VVNLEKLVDERRQQFWYLTFVGAEGFCLIRSQDDPPADLDALKRLADFKLGKFLSLILDKKRVA